MNNNSTDRKRRQLISVALALAVVVAMAVSILVKLRQARRARKEILQRRPVLPALPEGVEGLTEAEATARQLEGQDNTVRFRPRRSRGEIIRANIFNIFNLNLVGLVSVQLLLGRPLDALISFGVLSLNIGVNIAQELWARRRLKQVAQSSPLQATVIREGKVRAIDPDQIVLGDALVVGPGDQLFVDGQLVGPGRVTVDESMLTGQRVQLTKGNGDQVYAASFCISGRAAYEAQRLGDERLIATRFSDSSAAKEELTQIERIIERVLRVLLVIVAIYTALLLLRFFRLDTGISEQVLSDFAGVIFNIAPAGLFFMILVNYAAGSRELARIGALVNRSRSVESLAQATVMCFAQAGILTGLHVEMEPIQPSEALQDLSESRLRQILGDYARSTSLDNLNTRATVATFEGGRRPVYEEAPFMSLYGWNAIAFDDDDLRGVYVMGDPKVLEAYLTTDGRGQEEVEGDGSRLASVRKVFSPLGRLFKRSDETPKGNGAEPMGHQKTESQPVSKPTEPQEPDISQSAENTAPKPNLFRRLVGRVNRVIRREEAPSEEDVTEDETTQETVVLFAYYPELVSLYAPDGLPQPPDGLIPLCRLRYSERVRPEAIETIRGLSETGVEIKVFSAGDPERTADILKRAGLGTFEESPLQTIFGSELADADSGKLEQAALENTIFSDLTPEQAAQVVGALRQAGQSVAVVGNGVNDVPAMQQANLSIAMHSSSQAALSLADIILLEDSSEVLLRVLAKGQRIVNGLLDILKIYLSQVFYLALLILAIPVFAYGFPYIGKQGGLINLLTLTIPSLALSLWAAAGVLPSANLSWLLGRFVAPAAVTMAAAASVVYLIFLDRTSEIAYAQLGVTYTLVVAGLLLVIFVKPPRRGWVVGAASSGDWRPTWLALALLILFFVATSIPLAYELFAIERLRQPADYLVVIIAALAWTFTVNFVWRVIPVDRESPVRPG